jgi:hypothetical protein
MVMARGTAGVLPIGMTHTGDEIDLVMSNLIPVDATIAHASFNSHGEAQRTMLSPSTRSMEGEMFALSPFSFDNFAELDATFGTSCPDTLPMSQDMEFQLDGELTDSFSCVNDGAAGQDAVGRPSLPPTTTAVQHPRTTDTTPKPSSLANKHASGPAPHTRRFRKQNHACDQCRVAKRACNFRNDITTFRHRPLQPCTTCVSRSLDCTVEWLAAKQASAGAAKQRRARAIKEHQPAELVRVDGEPIPAPNLACSSLVPTSDLQLVRYFSVRETCLRHFSLYVDIVDMPLSHFLLHGMMPQRYSMGLGALSPLSRRDCFTDFWRRADEWVNSCWDRVPESRLSLDVAPHIFHTASVLDAIFERREALENGASSLTREDAINRAYKWAALASAARFSINPNGDTAHSRDFGYATWQRAKQTVFDNIAATGSFRLALALVIFGTIEPPGPIERRADDQEISNYALCEGVKRLQTLCHKARACLRGHLNSLDGPCFWARQLSGGDYHPAHTLSSEVQTNLLELIAAVEWLINFIHAARTVLSKGSVQPLGSDFVLCNTDVCSEEDEEVRSLGDSVSAAQNGQSKELSLACQILDNAAAHGPVTQLWHGEPSESTMLYRLKRCGMLSIFQWDALARLTVASGSTLTPRCNLERIRHFCINIDEIIKSYRAAFGTFDDVSASNFQSASPEVRRMAAMISNDSDLGILLYFDMLKALQSKVAQERASAHKEALLKQLVASVEFCAKQRLVSATQVSLFARARSGASPGLKGSSGLKAHIQDLAAHPVSTILAPDSCLP